MLLYQFSTLDPIAARFLSQYPCIDVLATDVTIMARFKFSNALRPQRSWGLLATRISERGHLDFHTPPELIWLDVYIINSTMMKGRYLAQGLLCCVM